MVERDPGKPTPFGLLNNRTLNPKTPCTRSRCRDNGEEGRRSARVRTQQLQRAPGDSQGPLELSRGQETVNGEQKDS